MVAETMTNAADPDRRDSTAPVGCPNCASDAYGVIKMYTIPHGACGKQGVFMKRFGTNQIWCSHCLEVGSAIDVGLRKRFLAFACLV